MCCPPTPQEGALLCVLADFRCGRAQIPPTPTRPQPQRGGPQAQPPGGSTCPHRACPSRASLHVWAPGPFLHRCPLGLVPQPRGRSGLCPGEDGAPPTPPCLHSVAAGGADMRVRPKAESALTVAVPTSQRPQQPARGRRQLPLPAPHPVSCLPWAVGVAGAPGPN